MRFHKLQWAIAKNHRLVTDTSTSAPFLYGSKAEADRCLLKEDGERAVRVDVTITEIKPKRRA
jgi:hypothetical protein